MMNGGPNNYDRACSHARNRQSRDGDANDDACDDANDLNGQIHAIIHSHYRRYADGDAYVYPWKV